MPLDPLAKRLLTMMAAAAPQARSRPSVEARRQSLAKLMQFARADAPGVTASDGVLPGPGGDLPYRLYSPTSPGERTPGFVFFHGGGLVAGSVATHDRIAAALAHATGCRLVSIDYRLAPEHKYPAAVDDAMAATEWVAREASSLGIDAERLVIGGDSAGATLAAIVCQEAAQSAGLSGLDIAQNARCSDDCCAAVQPLARRHRHRAWGGFAMYGGLMTRSAVGFPFGSPSCYSVVVTLPRIAWKKRDQAL